jgi:predicted TIM-barrel fold metal-dependent hydrolase
MTTISKPRGDDDVVTPSGPEDRYLVISIDGHCGPMLVDQLRPYCPEKDLATFDEYAGEVESFLRQGGNSYPGLSDEYLERRAWHAKVEGLTDSSRRLADLEAEGIAGEVIYHGGLNGQPVPFSPTGLLAYNSTKYNAMEPVGVRIYNRWLADFCAETPGRRVGVAHIPITAGTDACVREVEWAAGAGLGCVNLPAPRRDFPYYNNPEWEPFWSACEANDLVLSTHNGGGDLPDFEGIEGHALVLVEAQWFGRRPTWLLIFGGVFERHPGLKFVATEQYGDWVPDTLRDMDTSYLSAGHEPLWRVLPKKPSEYWMTNCWVGASFISRREAEMARDHGFVDRVMWGADYPHIEGTWPRTQDSIRKALAGFDSADTQKILGSNAGNVYGFDMRALCEVADRIGPTVQHIDTLLEKNPDFVGYSFREIGKFA